MSRFHPLSHALLVLALLWPASGLLAQALPEPPPPLPTDTEIALAQTSDVREIVMKAREWDEAGDLRRLTYALERLVQLRPYNGPFLYRLAQSYARQDMKTPAYDLLLRIQAQGLAYDPSSEPEIFQPIAGTGAYRYIVEGLQRNFEAFGKGRVAYTVQHDTELLESLAWDDSRGQLLIGSGRSGEILRVNDQGEAEVLAAPSVAAPWWGALALAVDARRDALWVATTALPHFEGFKRDDLGLGAILRLKLSDGTLLEHYPIPVDGQPHVVSAMTVGASGDLYAVDGLSNFVYRIRDNALEVLLTLPESTSLRGIALHPDEKLLYLSDYELGLRVADLEQQQVLELSLPNHNFGGIDSLSWWDGHLIAVQNYNPPKRIMRMSLDPSGRLLSAMAPLESSQPAMTQPTVGVIGKDRYWFIANSERHLYGPNGRPLEGVTPQRRVIYRLDPAFGLDQVRNLAPVAPAPGG